MAEISGLAFGAITLVSLFSTCIDLFERFEMGRNCHEDCELMLDKMSLLRTRLALCGHIFGGHPAVLVTPNDENLVFSEPNTFQRPLLRIRNLIQEASLLADKYRAASVHTRAYIMPASPHGRQQYEMSGSDAYDPSLGRHAGSLSLKRRASWALHDKERFICLISDLEFWIRHIEAVSESIARTAAMSKANTSHSRSNMSSGVHPGTPHTKNERSVIEVEGTHNKSSFNIDVEVRHRATLHVGNIGTNEKAGPHHYQGRTMLDDSSHAQFGNRDPEFELQRLRMLMELETQMQLQMQLRKEQCTGASVTPQTITQ